MILSAVSGLPPEFVGASWTFVGTLVLALVGYFVNYSIKRARGRASETEMWAQLDKLAVEVYGNGKEPGLKERVSIAETRADRAEKTAAATGRVIRDLAGQWAGPTPKLNPADLAEIGEDTLPPDHPWRKRPRSSSTAPEIPGR